MYTSVQTIIKCTAFVLCVACSVANCSLDLYSLTSLDSVIEAVKSSYSQKCRAVTTELGIFRENLRNDEEYFEDPILRYKYLKILCFDIKKKCGSGPYYRLLKEKLIPKKKALENIVQVIIPLMESYNLTIKDLSANGYNLGPVESIQLALMTGESTDLSVKQQLKYMTMFLDNVYADQELDEEEEDEFSRAFDIKMELQDDVEFKRLCIDYDNTVGTQRCLLERGLFENYHIEVLSEDPWVALYHNFLTDSELTTANAEVDKFRFSKGNVMGEGGRKDTVDFRDQIEFDEGESPFFDNIHIRMDRAIDLVGRDLSMEIYKYRLGGSHEPHMDFYSDEYIETNEELGNRIAITMIFLRNTKRGGGFAMPRLGIYVAPSPGTMLIWRNVDNLGWNSKESVHGGCPVYQGVKMIAITEFNALLQNDICLKDQKQKKNASSLGKY